MTDINQTLKWITRKVHTNIFICLTVVWPTFFVIIFSPSAFTRWRCVERKHCLIVFLMAGISFCLTSTYMVLEIKPGNKQLTTPVYDNDTVLLSSVNTFWYNEVVIHKANDHAEDDNLIQLYSALCNELVVHQQSFHSRPTTQHATGNVIIVEPTYFVANSVVNITITVLNVSSPAICVELYIFDDVSKYYPFKEENTEKSDTVSHEIVRTAGDSPVTTQVFFTIPKTSYYFFGLNTSAALTFQYSYEYLQLFYNNSDYIPPSCTLGNTNICSLSLLPSGTIHPTQTCILGYAAPRTDSVSPIYLDTDVNRNLWNPLTITFLGSSIVAWLITCNICFCLCCCVCARAGGKHNYVSINN